MILPIRIYPDPALRVMCALVWRAANVAQLLIDLRETMIAAGGLGLAAPQVGVSLRVAVVGELNLIDPMIVHGSGEATELEGCLSLPGLVAPVTRSESVTFEATDEHGVLYAMKVSGERARAVQHEIDHLNGRLFVDRLGPVTRDLLLKRWRKHGR